jgi:hypothetical protein
VLRIVMPPRSILHRLACALGLVAALLAVPAAFAQQDADPALWATVNVCDTERHPDTIGIRGSMPGNGRSGDRMFMRFTVQFQASDGSWRRLSQGGDSGWESVGNGTWEQRQSGYSFQVRPAERSVRLRGLVRFQWRRAGRVVRREVRATEAGHRSTAGADPRGWSRGVCVVRA